MIDFNAEAFTEYTPEIETFIRMDGTRVRAYFADESLLEGTLEVPVSEPDFMYSHYDAYRGLCRAFDIEPDHFPVLLRPGSSRTCLWVRR